MVIAKQIVRLYIQSFNTQMQFQKYRLICYLNTISYIHIVLANFFNLKSNHDWNIMLIKRDILNGQSYYSKYNCKYFDNKRH